MDNIILKKKDFKSFEDYSKEVGGQGTSDYDCTLWRCKEFKRTKKLDPNDWSTKYFKDDLNRVLITPLDLNNVSEEVLQKINVVLLRYSKKLSTIARKWRREHDKKERQEAITYKLFSSDTIDYVGRAEKRMLPIVVRELNLLNKFNKKSKIILDASTYSREDPSSTNRYTFTNHFASGTITIDGEDYHFEDIQYHHSGYDHFPPG